MADNTPCNICGGTTFEPAYKGRLSRGKMPACSKCKSYERHRAIRTIYDHLKPELANMRALQFAPDVSISRDWFKSFTGSVYGGENSMDMANTGLEAGAYDIIISNHVLEHVPDDAAAITELLRVVGPTGVLHVCVPSPLLNWETRDWGYPDPALVDHYREFGADAAIVLQKRVKGLISVAAMCQDPVTGIAEVVFFFASATPPLERIVKRLRGTNVAAIRVA
jgi:SAM-dependent methyltransferase